MQPVLLLLAFSPQLPIPEVPASPSAGSTSLSWFDLDGDGDRDLVLVEPQGALRVLRRGPGDVFEEAPMGPGLPETEVVRGVQPRDWDGDGLTDLMVFGDFGVRLLRQVDGILETSTGHGDLAGLRGVSMAAWVDANGDERPDLHAVTDGRHRVLVQEAGGQFQELDLGLAAPGNATRSIGFGAANVVPDRADDRGTGVEPEANSGVNPDRAGTLGGPPPTRGTGSLEVTTLPTGSSAPMAGPPAFDILSCVNSLADQAGGTCLQASSVPTYGQLVPYPGSNNAFDPSKLAVVAGGLSNDASGFFATVGGGSSNVASSYYSTVGGGEFNTASDEGTTVGGGRANDALSSFSTVGGGQFNTASASGATIGGGQLNEASALRSTVGGGGTNEASGTLSTVGGGESNTASGFASTVIGGQFNEALGFFSVAGGRRAKSIHSGAFVWGDSADADFSSTDVNQFLIRAGGGVGIGTNAPSAGLHVVNDEEGLRVRCTAATAGIGINTDGGPDGIGILAGGAVRAGFFIGEVEVNGGTDVTASGGGFLQCGDATALNLAIDDNEIMARDSGGAATLSLNIEGGDIALGGDTTGRVGVGSSSPSAKLDVFGASTSDVFRVRVDGTTRLVLDGNGTLGVGANFTPTFDLQVSASAPNGGTAAKPGGGSWSNASDRRLKKNIADLEGALETLLRLRGVTYEYKDPEAIDELAGTRIGFIAQEVEEVLPDWVGEKADGMKMLTIRGFEALAVEALRELERAHRADNLRLGADVAELRVEKDTEIASLRAELESLRVENAAMSSQLESFVEFSRRLESMEALLER